MRHDSRVQPETADPTASSSRRRFLAWIAGGAAAAMLPAGLFAAERSSSQRACHDAGNAGSPGSAGKHPDPRPGVDASRVLTAEQLKGAPHTIPIFDAVREMPQIADGIGCYCGCATIEGYRSLLSCYEGVGMATHCQVCQGQAKLAHRRWKEGQTLEQIRRAIDARYGDG